MTYITDEEDVAREWVIRLQRWKSVRERCSIQTARRLVATDTGISAGTIENIIRGRSKGIRQWLFERLRTAVMIELQREIAAHEDELAELMADPRGCDRGTLAEMEAGLARLRALSKTPK